ncbi:FecR family protein [Sphingomonas sp. DT-207]|uniref:FecR family protein n=1 Tax=Sphingomonas sp. DT-207 TaxID=3396167 RepID=UPI003F1DEFC9
MIRRLRPQREARRFRAADLLLRRRSGEDGPEEPATSLDEEAMLEMERIWSLTGMVADDPRIRRSVDADLARLQAVAPTRRFAAIAAALVLAVTGLISLVWMGDEPATRIAAAPAPSFATEVGQRKRMILPDSSRVALDTDSEIAIRMDDTARTVTLRRGRAYFKVTKDPKRPFVVVAGDKRVRAVGTAFEVRIDAERVIVTVVEGTVEVAERRGAQPAAHTARIDAGTQLVTLARNDWAIHRIDPDQATTWLTGRLSFVDEPLAMAVGDMNRYARQKLVFRNGQVPDERILGVFRAGDTLALAQAIEMNGFARIVKITPEQIEVEAE